MKFNGEHYRTVWFKEGSVYLIDQTLLPFDFKIYEARNYLETCHAIKDMIVRGAPAIGAAAGYAMAQAFLEAPVECFSDFVQNAKREIESTRPTAQHLFYAVNRVYCKAVDHSNPKLAAVSEAEQIADEDVEVCRKIGEMGSELIKDTSSIITHCNTGWLACVDYGTALSSVYVAHQRGKKVFVYVSETRPRSQGGKLTAWELKNENIPYCIFADSAGAYIMSEKKIDMVIVGADRIAKNGDVANKIGTLERAITAKELGIPFYVAAPTSTIDLNCESGKQIPIEQRSEQELLRQTGLNKDNQLETILVYPEDFKVTNPAFDVTPAKFITGIITEKGIVKPDEVEKLVSSTSK
jgi:methylthioribose-1-phosphate isomerase